MQVSYSLRVSTSSSQARTLRSEARTSTLGPVWSSGVVLSNQSTLVVPQGLELASGQVTVVECR